MIQVYSLSLVFLGDLAASLISWPSQLGPMDWEGVGALVGGIGTGLAIVIAEQLNVINTDSDVHRARRESLEEMAQ